MGQFLKSRYVGFSLVVVMVASYAIVVTRQALAARAAEGGADGLRRAIVLQPGNAEYHARLGEYELISQQNPAQPVQELREAVRLNSVDAQPWLDLALAYSTAGDQSRSREALQRAVALDPKTPDVNWQAGTLYLLAGENEAAAGQFRQVIKHEPERARPAFDMLWRTTHDPGLLLSMPGTPDAYLQLIAEFEGQDQPGAAARAWDGLIGLKQSFPGTKAMHYFDFLLSKGEYAGVRTAWQQAASLDSSFPSQSPGEVIVNGSFEQLPLNAGLDWRFAPSAGIEMQLDRTQANAGSQSLAITFTGSNVADIGVSQLLVLEAGMRYQLSAAARQDGLVGDLNLRFALEDAHSHGVQVLENSIKPGSGWQVSSITFVAQSDGAYFLKLVRAPSSTGLKGKIWLDDIHLVSQQP